MYDKIVNRTNLITFLVIFLQITFIIPKSNVNSEEKNYTVKLSQGQHIYI